MRRYLWLGTKFHLLLTSTAPIQPHLCSRLRQKDTERTNLNLRPPANRAARHRCTVAMRALGQRSRGTRDISLSLLAKPATLQAASFQKGCLFLALTQLLYRRALCNNHVHQCLFRRLLISLLHCVMRRTPSELCPSTDIRGCHGGVKPRLKASSMEINPTPPL